MAAYPTTIHQSIGTTREILSGLVVSQADDGSIRGRSQFDETQYRFTVVHQSVSDAERSTLLTFFETNKTLSVEYTFDGDASVYDVYFAGDPTEQFIGNDRWIMTFILQGAAQ